MSAGAFTTTKYQMSSENGGYVLSCRVQPETLDAEIDSVENLAPLGAINAPGSAVISRGRRARGVNMRYVTLKWTGAKPAGYSGATVRIPVLTPSAFAAWEVEKTGTYLNLPVQVVGRTSETVK